MPLFTPDRLGAIARRIIRGLETPEAAAAAVADHLVDAHLVGHDSHGVIRLPQYRNHVREGKVQPAALPEVLRESPTTALIDGHFGWGQVIAQRALELAIDKARSCSLAAVSVRNCYHIGRVGAYATAAAEAGFIAQIWCNGHGVCRVAPWGGTEPRLATNPIAVAVPTRGRPLLVDITTSVVAEGKIRVARNAGRSIPEGLVLDSEGEPTTRPEDLYEGGSLLPLGDAQGHKGYGLSTLVDLLGGALSGAGCGTLTSTVGNGVLLQLIDPDAFAERDELLERIDDFLEYLKSSKTRPGVEEILLPGDPEERSRTRRLAEGIPLDDRTWEQVRALADELGLVLEAED